MSSWLNKLGLGLKKSSERISGGINSIFTKKKVDQETLDDLEDLLLTCDLGVKASQRIIRGFSQRRLDKDSTEAEIKTELAADIAAILKPCEQPLSLSPKKPFVVLMVGVNGAGKTTTIGKLAAKFKAHNQISLIAGDTFRAAAVEQLEIWGQRNNIRIFKGEPGCDAAGLCFDGLNEAIKQGDDLVFIDTAGRLQNKTGLMDELKKIVKVIKKIIPEAPHATLLTLDATTGQNALNQAQTFKQMVDVSGLIITKLDGTAKGGIIVAIAEETGLPIHYIGIGESIDDLDQFNADDFARKLLSID